MKAFLGWCEGKGLELPAITPGMVGQYLDGLGDSTARRNPHLSALRGFFDRLVNRHVVILNPAESVKGVKETVVEGKTPEMAVEQARTLLASIRLSETVRDDQGQELEKPLVMGLRDLAILVTLRFTACRAGAVARLRLGDFQREGSQYVLRFQEKGGKSREIPVRHDLEGMILAYVEAAGIGGQAKDSPPFRAGTNGTAKMLTGNPLTSKRICELVKTAAEGCRAAGAAVAIQFPGVGDHRPPDARRVTGRCSIFGRPC